MLLAALTAGAVIALYFLKLRHRRVVISSSILWRRVLDEREIALAIREASPDHFNRDRSHDHAA